MLKLMVKNFFKKDMFLDIIIFWANETKLNGLKNGQEIIGPVKMILGQLKHLKLKVSKTMKKLRVKQHFNAIINFNINQILYSNISLIEISYTSKLSARDNTWSCSFKAIKLSKVSYSSIILPLLKHWV